METKYVTIPFDIERAKRITNGKEEGKIITRNGDKVRILSFDRKDEFRPIIALVNNGAMEVVYALSLRGKLSMEDDINKNDLMLSVPEWTTFKDGDIYKTKIGSIAIYNGNYKATMNNTPYYVGLRACDNKLIFQSSDFGFGLMSECTLDVSEEDRGKLIDALKASENYKAKEYLKRFFGIEGKNEYKFDPKQWVLTRESPEDVWKLDIFSHVQWEESEECYHYYCVGGWNYYCIPYNEETKHLLGTTNKWDE